MTQFNLGKLNILLADNFFYVTVAFGIIFLIMLVVIINTRMDLSKMRQRYKKMMTTSEGADLEQLLTNNAAKIKNALSEVERMDGEIVAIKNILDRAITRVAIVRYDAFEDISSDLSFSIAFLDENNSGVIISALNGRDSSSVYAKPIENGISTKYKLSKEEEQVLREASVLHK